MVQWVVGSVPFLVPNGEEDQVLLSQLASVCSLWNSGAEKSDSFLLWEINFFQY